MVLSDVNLEVGAGEFLAILGPSGCGKSTFLRVLCGLNRDWQGEITIAGEAITPNRSRAFFKSVQMVFQDPYGSLHPRHSVNTVLTEPLSIHRMDRTDARVAEMLDQVGLGAAFRYRYPHQLSGGQRQRLAIARALLVDAPILLLDEATSALDAQSEHLIQQALPQLMEGRTTLVIAHRLATVKNADRIAVMDQGKLVAVGTHQQLIASNPLYARLAALQFSDGESTTH